MEAYESFGEPLSPALRDQVAALSRKGTYSTGPQLMFYDWLRQLFERRRRDYAGASIKIDRLRTTRMASGAVHVHVDRR